MLTRSFNYPPGNPSVMGISASPAVPHLVIPSSSGSGIFPLSPTPPAAPRKPRLRMHKKGNPSVTSVTFVGESYWRSKAPKLVSLEVASQTPSIIKRGFEYMYHKSHGYRLTGGSLYFGPVPGFVRKSQRDAPPRVLSPLVSILTAYRPNSVSRQLIPIRGRNAIAPSLLMSVATARRKSSKLHR
jgi:hypothetical protein